MTQLIMKLAASIIIILVASQIARFFPSLSGLVAVMPLTSLIVLLWIYSDQPSEPAVLAQYCKGALWGIIPTIFFFITAYICFRHRLPMITTLTASFAVWLLGAIIHQLLLK